MEFHERGLTRDPGTIEGDYEHWKLKWSKIPREQRPLSAIVASLFSIRLYRNLNPAADLHDSPQSLQPHQNARSIYRVL